MKLIYSTAPSLSGRFKAPIPGHYMFQFHGLADSGNEIKVMIAIFLFVT